jgi:hypothetical protein
VKKKNQIKMKEEKNIFLRKHKKKRIKFQSIRFRILYGTVSTAISKKCFKKKSRGLTSVRYHLVGEFN